MTRVSGFLQTVIKEPSKVTGVWVRADRLRTSATGLTTPEQESVEWNPETGEISFDAEPGKATLVLQYLGRAESVLMVVPDADRASLTESVNAAGLIQDGTPTTLMRLALEIAADAAKVGTAAQVWAWAEQAQSSANAAAASETEAATAARNAVDDLFVEDPPGSGLFTIPGEL